MSASDVDERPTWPGTPVQGDTSKMLEDLTPQKLRQLAEAIEERDERDHQGIRRVRPEQPSWQEREGPAGALPDSQGPGIDLAEIIDTRCPTEPGLFNAAEEARSERCCGRRCCGRRC